MDTIYLVNYKMEKPVGVFDSSEKVSEFISNQLNPRNLPDPSPFVVFSLKFNYASWVNFISPDHYWDGDLLYRVKLDTNGSWKSQCLGFSSGFNSASNESLKKFYHSYCSDNGVIYTEDVIATSSLDAISLVQEKFMKIFQLLTKRLE